MKQVSLLPSFNSTIIQLGEFTLNTQNGELRREDSIVKIEPQLLEFLLLLIRQKLKTQEAIVSRAMMIETIWSGKSASDDAIRAVVKKLREVLKDDARRPVYIKTIPTKGYLLICEVQERAQGRAAWKQRFIKYGVVGIFAVLVFISLQHIYLAFSKQDTEIEKTSVQEILMASDATFVSADYHEKKGFLFSKQAENQTSLQLYLKGNDEAFAKRLTWDETADHHARWSIDGNYVLIYQRAPQEAKLSIYTFPNLEKVFDQERFDTEHNSDNLELSPLKPIAWLNEEDQVLIYRQSNETGLVEFYAYSITSKILKLKTSLELAVNSITSIEVSNDSQFLAIQFIDQSEHHYLALYNRFTNTLVKKLRLEKRVERLVWDPQSQQVSYLDSNAKLFSYDITSGVQVEWKGLRVGTQDLVGQCGAQCFMFTQHDGDFIDIVERRSPINEETILAARIIESPALDDLPIYGGNDELYFISKTEQRTLLQVQDKHNTRRTVFEFPSSGSIEALSLSPDNRAFVGEINNRIFLYQLDKGVFTFVTGIKEKAMSPFWLHDASGFTYKSINQERESTEHETKIEASTYYHYDLATSSRSELGKLAHTVINLSQNRYLVSFDGTNFVFTEAETLNNLFTERKLDSLKNSEVTLSLKSSSPNALVITDTSVFFLESSGLTNKLVNLDLATFEQQVFQLRLNSNSPHFALSKDLSRIALIRDKSTASRIVKLDQMWKD